MAANGQGDAVNDGDIRWIHVVMRIGVTAAAHPIEYAKVLIQVGYEPIEPRNTRTIFGKPALKLPGVFEYIGYMRRQVGFFGLYQGLPSRLCGSFTSGFVSSKVSELITVPETEGDITDEEKVIAFIQTNIRDSIARGAAIVASQPFHVITIRTMVQFIGGEEKYRGIFSSVREIWTHDGIRGFFSGVIPRLAGELLALWLASSLSFLLNTYLVDNKDLQAYTSASMAFIASALTYPFTLVSNIMCVTDCGLAAGRPPITPIYANWIDCWSNLSSQNQLKRGSSLLWRYYQGPQVLMNGKPRAVTVGFQPVTKKY